MNAEGLDEKSPSINELRDYLRKAPDEKTAAAIRNNCRRSFRVGSRSRGDVFGHSDFIILSDRKGVERHIAVADLPVSIGRGRNMDEVIDGHGISRRQCSLERDAMFVRIRDLQSKNGTLLNDKPIDEKYLCEGDKITIGELDLLVRRI